VADGDRRLAVGVLSKRHQGTPPLAIGHSGFARLGDARHDAGD